MGFEISADHTIFRNDFAQPLVILSEEFAEGLAPICQEPFAPFCAADDFSGEHRQPGLQGVSAACEELFRQVSRPGGGSGLIAVHEHMRDAPFSQHASGGFLIHFQVFVEIPRPGFLVEFIHLQPRCVGRSRVVHLARQRGAETVDAPAPGRKGAAERPVRCHRPAQVLDLLGKGVFLTGDGPGGIEVEVVTVGKSRFLFDVLQFTDGMEP